MILFLILFLLISQSRAYSDDNNKDNDDNNEIDENRCAVMFEGARCENVKRGLEVRLVFRLSWISFTFSNQTLWSLFRRGVFEKDINLIED